MAKDNYYNSGITTAKMAGTATTVGGSAVLIFAAIYLARANLPIELWPAIMDEPVAIAITALLSGLIRGAFNYLKHGRDIT